MKICGFKAGVEDQARIVDIFADRVVLFLWLWLYLYVLVHRLVIGVYPSACCGYINVMLIWTRDAVALAKLLICLCTEFDYSRPFNPLTPTVAIWVQLKHHVPDRVKPSFVIFDIWALRHYIVIRYCKWVDHQCCKCTIKAHLVLLSACTYVERVFSHFVWIGTNLK